MIWRCNVPYNGMILWRYLKCVTNGDFVASYHMTCYRGSVRLRSSLGSGHAELNLLISELSTLRQSLKDCIAIQQTGKLCNDVARDC